MEEEELVAAARSETSSPVPKRAKRGFSRKTLVAQLSDLGFPEYMINSVADTYEHISGKNYQDLRRRGLLFACLLHEHKRHDIPISLVTLARKMDLDTTDASRGIRMFAELAHKKGYRIDNLESSPMEYAALLLSDLERLNTWTEEELPHAMYVVAERAITSVLIHVMGVSQELKSSTPRCVAAAAVYFHFVAIGVSIDKGIFHKACGCSMVSIEKKHDEIARTLQGLLF